MADYNGTDEDDIIDASELDSDIGNIYPGKVMIQLPMLQANTQLFQALERIISLVKNLVMLSGMQLKQ